MTETTSQPLWMLQEEDYLRHLQLSCTKFSMAYSKLYAALNRKQRYFKIPAIIFGSASGMAAFGTNTFPGVMREYMPVIVGSISVFVAVINSIESYLKVSENMQASLTTHNAFQKLHDDIERELGIHVSNRNGSGINFLRDTYTRYQQIISSAPPLVDNLYKRGAIGQFLPKISDNLTGMFQKLRTVLAKKKPDVAGASEITPFNEIVPSAVKVMYDEPKPDADIPENQIVVPSDIQLDCDEDKHELVPLEPYESQEHKSDSVIAPLESQEHNPDVVGDSAIESQEHNIDVVGESQESQEHKPDVVRDSVIM